MGERIKQFPLLDTMCWHCDEPGLKRRVQLKDWRSECIYVCKACMPRVGEAILELRDLLRS